MTGALFYYGLVVFLTVFEWFLFVIDPEDGKNRTFPAAASGTGRE